MNRYIELGDERVPAVWEICPDCNGEGGSSRYLGAFTHDDIEDLGDEFREDYFSGAYDKECDNCRGSGKVLTPDEEAMTKEQRKYVEAWYEDLAEMRHIEYMERMMGA